MAEMWHWRFKVIHWTIAISLVLNWFFLEDGDGPHRVFGYLALAAVILRRFFGSYYQTPPRHNLLASLTYAGIWICVLGLAGTGYILSLEDYWGDEFYEMLHLRFSQSSQILVPLHLAGVFLDSYRFKRKTWKRMFP